METCQSCRYFSGSRTDPFNARGQCRRYPPNPQFPRANWGDWCGEHTPPQAGADSQEDTSDEN